MSFSTILNINSKYRTVDSISSTNFNISVGQSINIKQMVVKNVTIPNTSYNINSTNNQLRWVYNSSNKLSTLPIGQYNLAELASALQTAFIVYDAGATVTINPLTQKLVYHFSLPAQILINSDSSLSYLIGFNLASGVLAFPATAGANFTAPTLPNLAGIRNFFICSRTLAQGFNSVLQNGTNLPMILAMPNTVPFGSLNHYQSNDILLDVKSYKQLQNVQYIDIQILDENNNIVNLNGEDISLSLLMYFDLVI
jgi:hypothetical protein